MSIKLNDIPLDLVLKYFNTYEMNENTDYIAELEFIKIVPTKDKYPIDITKYETNEYLTKYSSIFSKLSSAGECYYLPILLNTEKNINAIKSLIKNGSIDSTITLDIEKVITYNKNICIQFSLNSDGDVIYEKYNNTLNDDFIRDSNYFLDFSSNIYFNSEGIIFNIEGNPYSIHKRNFNGELLYKNKKTGKIFSEKVLNKTPFDIHQKTMRRLTDFSTLPAWVYKVNPKDIVLTKNKNKSEFMYYDSYKTIKEYSKVKKSGIEDKLIFDSKEYLSFDIEKTLFQEKKDKVTISTPNIFVPVHTNEILENYPLYNAYLDRNPLSNLHSISTNSNIFIDTQNNNINQDEHIARFNICERYTSIAGLSDEKDKIILNQDGSINAFFAFGEANNLINENEDELDEVSIAKDAIYNELLNNLETVDNELLEALNSKNLDIFDVLSDLEIIEDSDNNNYILLTDEIPAVNNETLPSGEPQRRPTMFVPREIIDPNLNKDEQKKAILKFIKDGKTIEIDDIEYNLPGFFFPTNKEHIENYFYTNHFEFFPENAENWNSLLKPSNDSFSLFGIDNILTNLFKNDSNQYYIDMSDIDLGGAGEATAEIVVYDNKNKEYIVKSFDGTFFEFNYLKKKKSSIFESTVSSIINLNKNTITEALNSITTPNKRSRSIKLMNAEYTGISYENIIQSRNDILIRNKSNLNFLKVSIFNISTKIPYIHFFYKKPLEENLNDIFSESNNKITISFSDNEKIKNYICDVKQKYENIFDILLGSKIIGEINYLGDDLLMNTIITVNLQEITNKVFAQYIGKIKLCNENEHNLTTNFKESPYNKIYYTGPYSNSYSNYSEIKLNSKHKSYNLDNMYLSQLNESDCILNFKFKPNFNPSFNENGEFEFTYEEIPSIFSKISEIAGLYSITPQFSSGIREYTVTDHYSKTFYFSENTNSESTKYYKLASSFQTDDLIKETTYINYELNNNTELNFRINTYNLEDLYNAYKFSYYESNMRGNYIESNTFLNKRKDALIDSLCRILDDYEDAKNIDLNTEILNANGYINIYNYCKGITEFLKFDAMKQTSIEKINLVDIDDIIVNILTSDIVLNENTENTNEIPDYIKTSDSRDFLTRLQEYKKYPINRVYENLQSPIIPIVPSTVYLNTNVNTLENTYIKHTQNYYNSLNDISEKYINNLFSYIDGLFHNKNFNLYKKELNSNEKNCELLYINKLNTLQKENMFESDDLKLLNKNIYTINSNLKELLENMIIKRKNGTIEGVIE